MARESLGRRPSEPRVPSPSRGSAVCRRILCVTARWLSSDLKLHLYPSHGGQGDRSAPVAAPRVLWEALPTLTSVTRFGVPRSPADGSWYLHGHARSNSIYLFYLTFRSKSRWPSALVAGLHALGGTSHAHERDALWSAKIAADVGTSRSAHEQHILPFRKPAKMANGPTDCSPCLAHDQKKPLS